VEQQVGYKNWFGRGVSWADRNRPLFDLGIDFGGKVILDAGCNLGIVDYELSKFDPKGIHGVDIDPAALGVAKAIFSGVNVKHRFDQFDLGNVAGLATILAPKYDIVLLLRVIGFVRRRHGDAVATDLLRLLAGRCGETFIVTSRNDWIPLIEAAVTPLGFEAHRHEVGAIQNHSWMVLTRRR
jgi:2-polyprenyl-3-methyl-5-hydroxy-6-metoxy-1,4-benzoquinol methylase